MHDSFDLSRQKICFIFNPHSGHNARNPYLLKRTKDFIEERQLDARVELTARPKHATEIARQAIAENCSLVVAIGGDGTLNETAAALVGTSAVFGLIPCGSGNGLGRHLGLPGPGKGAYRTLLHGRVRSIDTGTANELPFFNAMGMGFDAEISTRFNHLTKRGLAAYVRTGMKAWFSYRPDKYIISTGDESHQSQAFIVAVANSDQYGNDCFIAPGAHVDDGRLNLTVLKHVNTWNALPLGWRLFRKKLDDSPHVTRSISERFTIQRSAPGPIHTDGEVHDTSAIVEVRVKARSLNILVPA